MVQISEIKIAPVKSDNGLKAFASLVIEDAFLLSSIGIFSKPSGGYYLTFPMRKNTRQNLNFFYPINKKVAEHVKTEVIKKFEEVTSS